MKCLRQICRPLGWSLLIGVWQFFSYSTAHALPPGCAIFGLPQLGDVLVNTSCQTALTFDTDNDGINDWTNIVDEKKSNTLIPFSTDIDGDGIDNIFDPNPLIPDNPAGQINAKVDFRKAKLPQHLAQPLEFSSLISSELEQMQQQLYNKTGILAVHSRQPQDITQLEILMHILTDGIGLQSVSKITKLKYFYTQILAEDQSFAKAFFINDLQAIVLSKEKSNINKYAKEELYETLSHEIGHAVIFSILNSESLTQLAREFGPWEKPFKQSKPQANLFDSIFMQSHPAYNAPIEFILNNLNVPSRYALTNVHEWFAEVFSAWVLENLARKGIIKNKSTYRLSPDLNQKINLLLRIQEQIL